MYNFYIHHSPQAVKKKYLKNDERNCEELSRGGRTAADMAVVVRKQFRGWLSGCSCTPN